jgi:hypothetical protein
VFRAEKERELGHAYSEIKGLKVTEALKDKAIAEVNFFNVASILSSFPLNKKGNWVSMLHSFLKKRGVYYLKSFTIGQR